MKHYYVKYESGEEDLWYIHNAFNQKTIKEIEEETNETIQTYWQVDRFYSLAK